jgi:hypothetical protein
MYPRPAQPGARINLTDLLLEPRLEEQDLDESPFVYYYDELDAARDPDAVEAPTPEPTDPMRSYPPYRPGITDEQIQEMMEIWRQLDAR